MNTNVKPGDRAIVVKAFNPENLGKIVRVIERKEPGLHMVPGWDRTFLVEPSDGVCWLVESLGGPMVIRTDAGHIGRGTLAIAMDRNLRRLEPPADEPEETVEHDSAPVAHA